MANAEQLQHVIVPMVSIDGLVGCAANAGKPV